MECLAPKITLRQYVLISCRALKRFNTGILSGNISQFPIEHRDIDFAFILFEFHECTNYLLQYDNLDMTAEQCQHSRSRGHP